MLFSLKLRAIVLLTVLMGFLVTSLFDTSEQVTLNVIPANSYKLISTPIENYQNAYVLPRGKAVLKNLSFPQSWLAPDSNDVLQLIFIIIYLIIIIFYLFKLNIIKPFARDISKSIKLLGYGIIVFKIVEIIRNQYYSKLILSKTGNDFILDYNNNSWLYALAFAMIFLWISKAYKKANELQKEVDLTI